MTTAPLILLAAGGTGGHLFPAEALGVELIRRGHRVRLVTDARALRYTGLFTKDTIDVVPSETVRSRTPWSLARTGAMLAAGVVPAVLRIYDPVESEAKHAQFTTTEGTWLMILLYEGAAAVTATLHKPNIVIAMVTRIDS